jgi:hypothetical protein
MAGPSLQVSKPIHFFKNRTKNQSLSSAHSGLRPFSAETVLDSFQDASNPPPWGGRFAPSALTRVQASNGAHDRLQDCLHLRDPSAPPVRTQATPTAKPWTRIITLDLKTSTPKHSGNTRLFG